MRSRGEYMRAFRQKKRLSLKEAGALCRCSGGLIKMIEDSDSEVTHPHIAARIARAFKMPKRMAESLMPKNYRTGPECDPEKFVQRDGDE